MHGYGIVKRVVPTHTGSTVHLYDCSIRGVSYITTNKYTTNIVAIHDCIEGDYIRFEYLDQSYDWILHKVVNVLRRTQRR